MEADVPFRIVLAIVCFLGLAIRGYYYRLARMAGGRVWYREGFLSVGFQRVCELAGMALVVAYLLHPPCLAWGSLLLPDLLRWLGAVLGFAGLWLLYRTHRALGENFAPVLHVRQNQTLVTRGPYRWVRHPMYTAMYLITASLFLLSALWVVGLLYWGSLTLVLALRVGKEEALMAEMFGDEYRAYSKRTGRFLPRLFL